MILMHHHQEGDMTPMHLHQEEDMILMHLHQEEDMTLMHPLQEEDMILMHLHQEEDMTLMHLHQEKDLTQMLHHLEEDMILMHLHLGEKNDDSDASPPRMKKTLDGKKAGLQNAKDLKDELAELKKRERKAMERLSDEQSGRNAKTMVRGRLAEAEARKEEER